MWHSRLPLRLKNLYRTYIRRSRPATAAAPRIEPQLAAILADEPDGAVQTCLSGSREKLQTLDVAAFWLQAVGDGTPLAAGHTDLDTNSPQTAHNVAWLAGYDDSLEYHQLIQIATQLFAHHLGVKTVASPSVSDRTILNDIVTASTTTATTLYSDLPAEDLDVLEPTSLNSQLEAALSLLDPSVVNHCWLQILCDRGDASVVLSVGAIPGPDPLGDESVTAWIDHPIEYFICIPTAMDPALEQLLHLRYLVQHQFVGAHMTDLSVEEFGTRALEMALEYQYLHETPGDL
jgi:hypothetical protein